MRRAFVITLLLGVVALLLALALGRNDRAFTLGVVPVAPVAELRPDHSVCQAPIDVPAGSRFDRVRVYLGTYYRPSGPPVRVVVRAVPSGAFLASGTIAGGYPDIASAPPLIAR